MASSKIPVIDFQQFSTEPQTVANDVLQACTEWRFFYVENHTVPQKQVDGMFQLIKAFFAQSHHVKNQTPYVPARNAGFKPAFTNGADAKSEKVDPREAFSINKIVHENAATAAYLPPGLAECRDTIEAFQREAQTFAYKLLECIALALGLPKDRLTSEHPREVPNFDNFELMHYPALRPSEVVTNRISPHTDWDPSRFSFNRTSAVSKYGLRVIDRPQFVLRKNGQMHQCIMIRY